MQLTTIGHATVLLELDGVRVLTDPLLRDRASVLRAHARANDPEWRERLDAVLLSHFHRDHFDPGSLSLIDRGTRVVGPPGTLRRVARLGFANAAEVVSGDSISVGEVTVTATPASHGRLPGRLGGTALGYVVAGSARAYFAGDTDLFTEMRDLAEPPLDVALLPIWGWGPMLGGGHLDPRRAAEALALLHPRIAVPIHWGVLYPLGVGWLKPRYLTAPARRFSELASELAPEVDVRVLAPGESLVVAPAS
jgi:L-ascorbate metabolism protein UlaG (beta-lactamase superfamily)